MRVVCILLDKLKRVLKRVLKSILKEFTIEQFMRVVCILLDKLKRVLKGILKEFTRMLWVLAELERISKGISKTNSTIIKKKLYFAI